MKKFLLFTTIIMTTVQRAWCNVEVVSPELKESLKVSTNEPNLFSIVASLFFVLLLIYITGVIYSKLNIVGAKTVRDQLKKQDLSNVVVLSTTQLGQGKNLHVIELNKQKMLIGVTQNSINLIKVLDDKELNSKKEEPVEQKDKTVKNIQNNENIAEQFDVHKKYL